MVEKKLPYLILSERERKLLTALRLKKRRVSEQLFIAEGEKVIEQLLQCFEIELLIISECYSSDDFPLIRSIPAQKIRSTSTKSMKSLSLLESRYDLIAIFRMKLPLKAPTKVNELSIGLEMVQNPGNMGTIIRLCDWLGIKSIFCSKGCVDVYSPKVIQATAGALGNVHVYEDVDLIRLLPSCFDQVIGTTLSGKNYLEYTPPTPSTILLFGNEGNGLSDEVLSICDHNLSIPAAESAISESLNVSLSAAILLSHFNQ